MIGKPNRVFAVSAALLAMSCALGCSSSSSVAGNGDAGESDSGPSSQTIPVTMITAANGATFATVQVSVGGSDPFTALLDTGSNGLRIVQGLIPDGDANATTTTVSATFGSGLVADGLLANAVVTVGGVATNAPVAIQQITAVSCSSTKPNCSAIGKTATTFRFAGTFPAILGVGFRIGPTGLANPLVAMGTHRQVIFSLPHFGDATGALTIDPPASVLASLATPYTQLAVDGSNTANGISSRDDTQVPFCANGFCANALLDTGATGSFSMSSASDYAALGVPGSATSIPPGTEVTVTIDKTSSWSFTVGTPPVPGKDDFPLVAGGSDSLGITPFYQFDILYDYGAGQIGLVAKP